MQQRAAQPRAMRIGMNDIGHTTRHDLGTRALGILKALADHPDRGIDAWVVAEVRRMTAEWDATFKQPTEAQK